MADVAPGPGLWWTSCWEGDGETWHWLCGHLGACDCRGEDRTMPACGVTVGSGDDRHPTAELGPGDRFCETCLRMARTFLSDHPRLRTRAQALDDVWPAKVRELAGSPGGPRSESFPIAPSVRVDWERTVPGDFFVAFYDAATEELVASIMPREDVLAGTDFLYAMSGRVFVHPVSPSPWKLTITTLEVVPAALPLDVAGFGLQRTGPFTVDGLALIETTGTIKGIHLLDPVGGGAFEHLVPAISGGPIPIFGDGGAYALLVTGEGDWKVRVREADVPLRLASA